MAALYRDLHRHFWPEARDVREQLPGRQGQLRLCGAVERLQTHRRRLFRRREGRTLRRHRDEVLPVGINPVSDAISGCVPRIFNSPDFIFMKTFVSFT
jgi:hypothetical protein